jgi:cobalt-zinc-cadmium efflux system outer membrane protein
MQQQNKTLEVRNEVVAAFQKLNQIEQEYHAVDQNFRNDFELVNNGYIQNFQKRNISIVEFVDFFEAYNASIRELNKLNERRIRSYEELNYTAGVELFKK